MTKTLGNKCKDRIQVVADTFCLTPRLHCCLAKDGTVEMLALMMLARTLSQECGAFIELLCLHSC